MSIPVSKPPIPLAEALERIKAACERGKEMASAEVEAEADAEARRQTLRGIPELYARVLRAGVDMERPAMVEIRKFLASPRPLLVLAGGVGVGKSVAAAWAVANYAGRAKTVAWWRGDPDAGYERGEAVMTSAASSRFVLAYKLIQAGTFDKDFWRMVEEPRLLVLDELGGEPMDAKGMGLANLTSLLTHRHAHDIKTIVTTNATWDQFRMTYCNGAGARTLDRIREHPDVFLKLDGESMRHPPQRPLMPFPLPTREPGDDDR